MIKRFFKRALLICAVLLIAGIAAVFALTGVFRLQPRRMYENLQSSIYTFREDGQYPMMIHHHETTMLDNFTDALMINQAIFSHPDIGAFERAIHIYRWLLPEDDPSQTESLVYLLENEPQGMNLVEYGRYWHGYIVLLRPLLLLFDYEGLRILIGFIQITLIGTVIALLGREKRYGLIAPFIGYILAISPIGTVLSLQFFSVQAITLCACVLLLLFEKRMSAGVCGWFFLAVGMLTSFFDLLTFPVISFGIPVCLLICLRRDDSVRRLLGIFVRCGIMWCVGYLGFWATKWLLGALFGAKNLWTEALQSVQCRTSDQVAGEVLGAMTSRFEAIFKNLAPISELPFYVAIAAGVGIGLTRHLYCRDVEIPSPSRIALMFMVAAIPFVWWWMTANHAYRHYWFTYRSISITVFAVFACLYGERESSMQAA